MITIQDDIGPGLVLWHPKGSLIRLLIENFWREQHIKDSCDLDCIRRMSREARPVWKRAATSTVPAKTCLPDEIGRQRYRLKPILPFHIMIYKLLAQLSRFADPTRRVGHQIYRYAGEPVCCMGCCGSKLHSRRRICSADPIRSKTEVNPRAGLHAFSCLAPSDSEFEIYLSTRPEIPWDRMKLDHRHQRLGSAEEPQRGLSG